MSRFYRYLYTGQPKGSQAMRMILMGALLAGSLSQSVCSQPETPPQPPPEPDWKVNGYLQTSYSRNAHRPSDGRNLYHGYAQRNDLIRFDILELNAQYRLDQPGHTGFRVDIDAGGSMPRVDAAAGLFRDANTGISNSDFDVRQAFLSHTFDNNLRIDAGKFSTFLGYEVMDGVDGRNPNGTRALAFTYSPFTHTGLRMTYPLTDKLNFLAMVSQGADNAQLNGPNALSCGAQLNYHPTDDFYINANAFVGSEQLGTVQGTRKFFEVVANYKIDPTFTVGLDALTTTDPSLRAAGGTANGNALVLYFLTQIDDHISVNLRQEWYNDPDGVRLERGGAHYTGFTVTPEYRITPDWVVRMDFRFDRADRPVYDNKGRFVPYQNSIFLGQSYRF